MRHATLRQMQVFEAVARRLNFSEAARELNLTQPAVSLQIKQFEGLAQLPLFEQTGRRLHLTSAGEMLLGHVHAVLGAVKDAEEAMDAVRGRRAGGLKIGGVSTAKYFAPFLLSAFAAGFPGVEVSLAVANRRRVVEMLEENSIDLALMGQPPDDARFVAVRFARHPLVVIAAPSHPLTGRRIQPKDLNGETFLVREPGSGTRAAMERLLAEHAVTPGRMIEMSSNETIKQAVMAGMGVSFLSQHTIGLEASVRRLEILQVEGTPVLRTWNIVHREGKRLLPVGEAFIRFLTEHGARVLEEATRIDPPRRGRTAR